MFSRFHGSFHRPSFGDFCVMLPGSIILHFRALKTETYRVYVLLTQTEYQYVEALVISQ
jgi:hypothetical protein